MAEISVADNAAAHRFEARVDDDELAGFAAYRIVGSTIVLTHTEVQPDREGQGVGSSLVRQALDEVRGRGLQVQPQCPFVHSFIERHPAYQDLVAG